MLLMIVFIIIGLLLYGYSFLRYRYIWSRGRMPILVYYVFQAVLLGTLFAYYLFCPYMTNDYVLWSFQILIDMFLTVMLVTPFFSLFRGGIRMIGKRRKWHNRVYRFFNHPTKISWIVLAVTLLLGAGVFFQSKFPRFYENTCTIHKEAATDSFSILTISDLQIGRGMTQYEIRTLFDQVKQYHPDMVVFLGNLYSRRANDAMREFTNRQIGELISEVPVYLVEGPNEAEETEEHMEDIRRSGVRILQDDFILLSNGIQLVGLCDQKNEKRSEVSYTCSLLSKEKPAIVFSYEDLTEEEKKMADYDVLLHALPVINGFNMPKQIQLTHIAMPKGQEPVRSER